MTEINRYRVFLNSDQRTHGSNDYFQVVLNKPFVLENENNYFTVQVDSASIPFSFKSINDRNHTIKDCSATIDGETQIFDLTVPNGNYSAEQFIEVFRQVLYDQIFIKFAKLGNFRFTYNQATGKFTLECLNSGFWNIYLNLKSSNLLSFFGFSTDFHFTSSYKATSTQHVVMSPIKALFIRADSITLDNYEALLEPIMKSDILCRIHISSGYNSWIQYSGDGSFNRLSDKIVNTIIVSLRGHSKNSVRGNSKSSVKKSNKNSVKIDFKPTIKVHVGDRGVKSASSGDKPGFSGFPFLGYQPHPPQGPPPPQIQAIPQKNNDLLNHQILTQYRRELNFLREERQNPQESLAPGASRPSFEEPNTFETPNDYENILSRATISHDFGRHTPEISSSSVPPIEIDEGKNEVKTSRIEAQQHAHDNDEEQLAQINAQLNSKPKPKPKQKDPSRMTVQELAQILSARLSETQAPLRQLGVVQLRKMYFDEFGKT